MLIVQVIFIVFILFALIRTLRRFREGNLSLAWLVFWIFFWLGVGTVVMLPEITSRLAQIVGITRGVDLAVYASILVLFYLIFRVLVKIESLEQEITRLVREIALSNKDEKPRA